MARKKHLRKIVSPPRFKSFNPTGIKGKKTGDIDLLYEEYEAIKLADYDLLTHKEASELMDVSRATFARIYESARRKIAISLVEVKELKSVFGNVKFDNSWSQCKDCSARFNNTLESRDVVCAFCGSSNIILGESKNKI